MSDNPQDQIERRAAARHLLARPLTCAEHDPDVFRLIRRHDRELDRWFTQRLGYRLHVDADTARLYKTTALPWSRPLRTVTGRAFTTAEYTLLALVLACTAAGPNVISLRDLVEDLRSAAAEASIVLVEDPTGRRAVVTVLRWMIAHGLADEMHERVDSYAIDDAADAVLRIRADRIALLPLPALVGADSASELIERSERRSGSRTWLRARLVEDPVIYRDDLAEEDWRELRRRLGEDRVLLADMLGLQLEARAEGVAAIDPSGSLSDQAFPTGGTLGHATLLVIERILPEQGWVPMHRVEAIVVDLVGAHAGRWSKDLVANPERLTRHVVDLLVDLRLVERTARSDPLRPLPPDAPLLGGPGLRLLPAAARFAPVDPTADDGADRDAGGPGPADRSEQDALW